MASCPTLDQLRVMLACNKHRLDDELELQPDMMERISRQVVVMTSRMLEAKDDLARIEGSVLADLKTDDPKLTVQQLEAGVRRDSSRIRAWQKFQQARADCEEWSGMLEAWRQKGYSLKVLADLHAANYFSANSASAPRDRSNQDEMRAAMRRAGQNRSEAGERRDWEGSDDDAAAPRSRRRVIE